MRNFVRPPMNHEVEQHGFAIVTGVLGATEQGELAAKLGSLSGAGRRGLLALPAVSALAGSSRLLDIVRPYLASEPVPVRAIYFDKCPEANWLVSCRFGAFESSGLGAGKCSLAREAAVDVAA